MPLFTFLAAVASGLGNVVRGFFGVRTSQQQAITSALQVISNANSSEKDRAVAFAQYMAAEAGSGYWLAACIRPIMALLLIILVGFWFFGFAPPNITAPMPPFIEKAVDTLMVFMGVYVPGRSLEKIVTTIMTSSVLKKYIDRYL